MKKLFSLLTLALLTLSAVAQTSVVLDFTTNDWGFPVGSSAGVSGSYTHTNGDYTIAINATTKYYWNSSDKYLLLGKSGSTLTLPEFNKDVKKIEITGKGGASAAVKQNIYVGENAVSTETTGATGLNTYEIAADYQAAGNVYTLKVTSGHNTQITKIEVFFEETTPVDPTYTEVANLAAANVLADNTEFQFKGDAVVTYQYGRYLYLRDGSGYGLIFNTSGVEPTFNNGDVLAQDWTAKKTTYDGYPEYTDYSALSANGTNLQLAAPQVIDALDANLINAYVQINNVVSISGTTATLADGSTITLYKRFDAVIPAFENGDYYIRGIVSQHEGNLQLNFIGSNYEAPVEDDITTLAQANNLEDGVDFTFKGDAVVTYHNGKYLFLRDNSGYGLIYYTSAPAENFANGVVLNKNWTAQKTTYNGLDEFQNPANVSASGNTNATLAAVQTITAADMANMINAYVKIEHVKSISGTTATLTDGSTITLFKRFNNCPIVEFDNADCTITGIVSIYGETLQLYFISTDYVAPAGVDKPVITPNGGTFANEVEVTITCATEDAEIIYTINNGDEMTYSGPFTLTESATVKAYAATDDAESEMAEATFTIVPVEEATYALVTDVTTLADGDKIIIVNANEAGEAYAMGAAYSTSSTSYFQQVSVNIAENLTITTADANVITLGANGNNWTLKATEGYLAAASSSKNFLVAKAEVDSNAIAAIAIADTASIVFQGNFERNIIRYNAQNTRFSCYGATNTQAPVYIYKLVQDQPEVKLGDVNKDGVIRIDDVTALIDALLGGNTDIETEHYSPANADVNQDTFIRIDDVTALIDMLLSGAAK